MFQLETPNIRLKYLDTCYRRQWGPPGVIKKNEWPPESPDCNPMDYAIWDSLKEKVYQGVRDKLIKQALNNRINISWDQISVEGICKSISAWTKWLHFLM